MMNVAIIGFGYWGPNLVRNFLNADGCSVTHVCDLDLDSLKNVKKTYPFIVTTQSAEEIFSNDKIDSIVIATPVSTHYNLAMSALESNKHVLVEKPLTDNIEDAKKLGEKAKEKGKILMIDHTYLYTPAIEKIKKMIDENKIGKIQYIDSTRINLGLMRSDVNVLWDLASHDIAICLYLIKEKPYSVNAVGKSHVKSGIEDLGYLTLNFKSDIIAHFNCSWISPVKIRHMLIGGNEKMIVFNDLESTEKVKLYDSGYQEKISFTEKSKVLTDYRVGDIYIPKTSTEEGLSIMVKDFINSIKANKQPISNFSLGLEVVKILIAAQNSMKEKGNEVLL